MDRSRAAYLSGYYPFRLGVQNSVVREGMADYVPVDVDFLPKRLKEAGYSTHLVGKWHLGHCRRDVTPPAKGFDTFLGLLNGYNDYYTKKIRPIASHEDFDPNAPGTIYDFFSNYTLQPSSDTEYTTVAMVTAMDAGIGQVMQTLKEEKLTDNTLVIFQSDNGGDTHFAASNDPLRARKTTLYEGGVRVPSMAYGPGLLANTPRVSNDLFHIVDWSSTILGAAGLEPGNVDGVNQWNLLRYGSDGPRKVFIYNILGNNAAIRAGKYKLIEGDADTFQARRRRRSAEEGGEHEHAASSDTSQPTQTYATSREPIDGDEDKAMKAFNSLTGLAKINRRRRRGDWTMAKILTMLESYGAGDVTEPLDCSTCQLFDLEADPSESTNLAQERPAVLLYMYKLLELYKAEEVEPVLAYTYKQDPRFQELKYTSNTWCEE